MARSSLRRPVADVVRELSLYQWDSDVELVHLTRNDAIRVLDGYLSNRLSDDDVASWANEVEGRDDIAHESFMISIGTRRSSSERSRVPLRARGCTGASDSGSTACHRLVACAGSRSPGWSSCCG